MTRWAGCLGQADPLVEEGAVVADRGEEPGAPGGDRSGCATGTLVVDQTFGRHGHLCGQFVLHPGQPAEAVLIGVPTGPADFPIGGFGDSRQQLVQLVQGAVIRFEQPAETGAVLVRDFQEERASVARELIAGEVLLVSGSRGRHVGEV